MGCAALEVLAGKLWLRAAMEKPSSRNGCTSSWVPRNTSTEHASFNSELGVPLTLSALTDQHQSALVEVGIDEVGAMQRHEQLVRPTIGIFTTLGVPRENFESDEQKFREKFKLFEHCHSLVIGRKWLRWAQELGLKIPQRTLVWGQEVDPDAIKDWPFSGDYQKENALRIGRRIAGCFYGRSAA